MTPCRPAPPLAAVVAFLPLPAPPPPLPYESVPATALSDVLAAEEYAREVSRRSGLPVVFTAVRKDLRDGRIPPPVLYLETFRQFD